MKEPASTAAVERYLGAIVGTVYIGLSVGIAVADYNEDSPKQKRLSVGITAGLGAFAFSSYLAPDRARRPMLGSMAPLSVAALGAMFYGSQHGSGATRFTLGSIMATGAVMEGLILLDAGLQRPVSGRVLERQLERLKRDGENLSSEDLYAIERELALTERPIPLWMIPAVFMGGAIVAAAPALAKSTSRDDRATCLVFSSLMFIAASPSLSTSIIKEQKGFRAYREGLRNFGLAPLGPQGSAGVTLTGTF